MSKRSYKLNTAEMQAFKQLVVSGAVSLHTDSPQHAKYAKERLSTTLKNAGQLVRDTTVVAVRDEVVFMFMPAKFQVIKLTDAIKNIALQEENRSHFIYNARLDRNESLDVAQLQENLLAQLDVADKVGASTIKDVIADIVGEDRAQELLDEIKNK